MLEGHTEASVSQKVAPLPPVAGRNEVFVSLLLTGEYSSDLHTIVRCQL